MQRVKDPNRLDMSDSEQEKIVQFKSLLQLLELERRTFAKAQVPEGTQEAFDVLLRHLNQLSVTDIAALYQKSNSRSPKPKIQVPSAKDLDAMSLEEIERLIACDSPPRRLLEEIAVVRFHFPRGSLRSLPTIKLLKDKIDTRIRNERTHGVISSIAQRAKQ
jgi:hypothetical protein